MKYHHCLLDGVAGASLATVLLDLELDAAEPLSAMPTADERSAGPDPDGVEVLGQVAGSLARRPLRLARYVVDGAAKLAVGANAFARDDDARTLFRAPATPFNKPIGPRRGLAFSSVALEDLRELKDLHGVKINDLVIARVAASFREVLLEQGALPEAPLVTGVPVSTRAEGDATHDNQVSNMFVSMATDIADPVERLQAIYASSQKAKALQRALSARQIQSLGEVASPLVLSTAIRALYESRVFGRGFTPVNTVVSNVPGPPVPVYMCGARVTGMFPCSVIVDGMGVNATIISIMERVDFGFHVDPDIVSDPWALADAVPRALAELKAASGLGPPLPVQDAFGESVSD